MAFNNGFPATYQPMYYQPQYQVPQVQQPVQQQSNGIIWVSGEAGAKAYLVAPNNTVQLWDSESQTIYLKSADASGMPSMKILDYTIRDTTPVNGPVSASASSQTNSTEYATKAEFKAIQGEIDALKAAIGAADRKGAALNE
jgi:hypothetical protein